jgi:dienelactone hydrolase
MTHRVGVASEVFVDASRPTNFVEGIVAPAPTRTLLTTVWYPARANGLPDNEGSSFPLVVLGHGTTGRASDLGDLATVLATHGYVVAAPDFPETSGGSSPIAYPNVVHQPSDLVFVLDAMLAANHDRNSRYHDLIDSEKIGFGGRSLGGVTVLLALYHTRFGGEPRVCAAFCAAGLEFPVEGGVYDYVGKPPLLLVHGDADPVMDHANSAVIFGHAQAPKYFLTLKGQGHVNYFNRDDASFDPFAETVLAFCDRYVKRAEAAPGPADRDDASTRLEGQAS